MVIFIICKDGSSEFSVPVFSARLPDPDREGLLEIAMMDQSEKSSSASAFMDRDGRVYKSWSDFRINNTLPSMK